MSNTFGRVLDLVKDDNWVIIYTSDNGPWWIKKDHGGRAQPLRGTKTLAWEGGLRVPFVIRAPGATSRITAGRTNGPTHHACQEEALGFGFGKGVGEPNTIIRS